MCSSSRSLLSLLTHLHQNQIPNCWLIRAVGQYLLLLLFFFHFIFVIITQWKCKLRQLAVYFQVFAESSLTLAAVIHLSDGKPLVYNRTQWLQHCSYLIIFPISSRLPRFTHSFVIINHLNPSAAFDNYRRLAENLTLHVEHRKTGNVRAHLPFRKTTMFCFFFPPQAAVYCRHYMLMLHRAGRVKSRWNSERDTEEEVWVYICPVDGKSKSLSTVQVNHWYWSFCTLQANKDLQ